eukprot:scaffold6286_cov106-Isochrysis_galbana.AAC.5
MASHCCTAVSPLKPPSEAGWFVPAPRASPTALDPTPSDPSRPHAPGEAFTWNGDKLFMPQPHWCLMLNAAAPMSAAPMPVLAPMPARDAAVDAACAAAAAAQAAMS